MTGAGDAGRAATWYVRRGDRIRGPYPAGIIGSYLILGRIHVEDDVSLDGEHWQPLAMHPELIPALLRDDGVDEERLMAARRWHDERRLVDRRRGGRDPSSAGVERRQTGERRREQPAGARRRPRSDDADRPSGMVRGRSGRLFVVLSLALIMPVVYLMFQRPVPDEMDEGRVRDCRAPAGPAVDWSHCMKGGVRLEGGDLSGARLSGIVLTAARLRGARLTSADLSYADLHGADLRDADLSGARLVGANLRRADLSGARLSGARLLYADLRGATIDGAVLEGADLGQAIWIDGRLCESGSIGACRRFVEGDERR